MRVEKMEMPCCAHKSLKADGEMRVGSDVNSKAPDLEVVNAVLPFFRSKRIRMK